MADDPRKSSTEPGQRLMLNVAIWLMATLAVSALVFGALGWIESGEPWPWGEQNEPELYEITRSTVAVVALLGGTVAAAVALRRQRSTEASVRIAGEAQLTSARAAEVAATAARVQADAYALDVQRHRSEKQRDLHARFAVAAEQVGNRDSAAVRLAGLYTLSALAEDWADFGSDSEPQKCVDVLCAYLRIPPDAELRTYMRDESQKISLRWPANLRCATRRRF